MKCCASTDVGTWTNWLSFEPNPDYCLDAGTGLVSPISCVLQCGILLRRENPTYRYWAPVAAARRGFKMVLFTASRGNTESTRSVDLQGSVTKWNEHHVHEVSWLCPPFVCLFCFHVQLVFFVGSAFWKCFISATVSCQSTIQCASIYFMHRYC